MFGNFDGTIRGLFSVRRATLDDGPLTTKRTYKFPDRDGVIALENEVAFSGALAGKMAPQIIRARRAWTTLSWELDAYDIGSWHDMITNNSRFIVPAGVNRVIVQANIEGDPASDYSGAVRVLKNGAMFHGMPEAETDSAFDQVAINLTSAVIQVVPGDYFQVQVMFSRDPRTVSANQKNWFSIRAV